MSIKDVPVAKRTDITFCKEKYMSGDRQESLKVAAGCTLTSMGNHGEMYSSRSGGIFAPPNPQRMSRKAFAKHHGYDNVAARAEDYMKSR